MYIHATLLAFDQWVWGLILLLYHNNSEKQIFALLLMEHSVRDFNDSVVKKITLKLYKCLFL